jgi:hypothetical protein
MPFIKFDPDTCTKTHWEVKRLRKRSTEKKYFSALLFPLLPSKMMKKNKSWTCKRHDDMWIGLKGNFFLFFLSFLVDAEGWEWKILNFTYIYSQTHTSNLINYKICVFFFFSQIPSLRMCFISCYCVELNDGMFMEGLRVECLMAHF